MTLGRSQAMEAAVIGGMADAIWAAVSAHPAETPDAACQAAEALAAAVRRGGVSLSAWPTISAALVGESCDADYAERLGREIARVALGLEHDPRTPIPAGIEGGPGAPAWNGHQAIRLDVAYDGAELTWSLRETGRLQFAFSL